MNTYPCQLRKGEGGWEEGVGPGLDCWNPGKI